MGSFWLFLWRGWFGFDAVLGVHAVDEVADHLLGEVDFGIGVFSGEAFEGVNGDAFEGDVTFVGGDDFADLGFGAAGELGGVGDGFDLYIFTPGLIVTDVGLTLGDLGAEDFHGALDAGGETVQFAEDSWEEAGRFIEDVFDAEAHGLAVEVFHLEEADLHVDELVDEGHLARGDGVELFDEVGSDTSWSAMKSSKFFME